MGSVFQPKPEVTTGVIRQLVGLVRKVASKLGGFAGATSAASDPTCDHLAGLDKIPPIVRGFVIRSGIGSYDCEVAVPSGTVVCSMIAPVLSDMYGASQSCMPIPGTQVLVYLPPVGLFSNAVTQGVILGILPAGSTFGTSRSSASVSKLADTEYPEGGVAQFTESGPAAVASDRKFLYKAEYQCGRPHDIVPGEYAITSHSGTGVVVGAVSTTIKGSEAASVRCSALDDQVRVTSGHFRHINAAGSEEIFSDRGYISVESFVSMYQPERLGVSDFGDSAFTWDGGSPAELTETSSGIKQRKAAQTAKKRLYTYYGYLGDIVNIFVANPDPDKGVEDMTSASKDQGLMHCHVDSSGRVTVRSAAGIMLERYDRIPIPKRTHYAWDPAGDKAESEPEDKKGFELPKEYPMGIGVTLGDMASWWSHLSYARLRQFSGDFSIPKQSDLRCPDNDYDKLGKASEPLQEYDTRHSYMGLTPNGGIVLRDAWGSEIVMADGRITLNAAANIEVRSGSSVVIMGGDDVIAKAYNSMDLSATKKDIRIKAENNMQVVSMQRGILIQSKAKGNATPSWDQVGEDLLSTGVVIKADASSVSVIGERTSLQGLSGVSVASFGEDGNPSGSIVMAGQQVSAVAQNTVMLTAGGSSGLIVGEQSAILCAPSVLAVGGQSAADISGNQMMLGIPVDVGSMYSSLITICKSHVQLYLNSVAWLNPLPPTVFSQVDFKFRTTPQYGTDTDSGLMGGVFSVYEPSWAVLMEASRRIMGGGRASAWDEGTDAIGGYPWPGEQAMLSNTYVTYKEVNITGDGIENAESEKAALTPTGFSSYHIRKRN